MATPEVTEVTREKRRWETKFFAKLAETGIVSIAAKAAGITREHAYRVRREDPEFAARWAEAEKLGDDMLEEVARQRALKTSDTLLIFLLKAAKPEKYRENMRVEHGGTVGIVPITEIIVERAEPEDAEEPV